MKLMLCLRSCETHGRLARSQKCFPGRPDVAILVKMAIFDPIFLQKLSKKSQYFQNGSKVLGNRSNFSLNPAGYKSNFFGKSCFYFWLKVG